MAQPAYNESVPIPLDLQSLLLARLRGQSISAWATEAVIVEAVREHVISRNKAATLLELEDYETREDFFERHQLFNEYTVEMLDEDFKTIDLHLGSPNQ